MIVFTHCFLSPVFQEKVLLAAKGPYMLAFELQWPHAELIVTNKVAKLLSGKNPVCGESTNMCSPYLMFNYF